MVPVPMHGVYIVCNNHMHMLNKISSHSGKFVLQVNITLLVSTAKEEHKVLHVSKNWYM